MNVASEIGGFHSLLLFLILRHTAVLEQQPYGTSVNQYLKHCPFCRSHKKGTAHAQIALIRSGRNLA